MKRTTKVKKPKPVAVDPEGGRPMRRDAEGKLTTRLQFCDKPSPNRPVAPTPESLAANTAWVRRNFEGFYTDGLDDGLRPNSAGTVMPLTEGLKFRGVFWDLVCASP